MFFMHLFSLGESMTDPPQYTDEEPAMILFSGSSHLSQVDQSRSPGVITEVSDSTARIKCKSSSL